MSEAERAVHIGEDVFTLQASGAAVRGGVPSGGW